jgi:hypothetical protein
MGDGCSGEIGDDTTSICRMTQVKRSIYYPELQENRNHNRYIILKIQYSNTDKRDTTLLFNKK